MTNKLDPSPYKGTRDFYPRDSVITWSKEFRDQAKQSYIFDTFRKTLISNGFLEYSTSLIESAEAFILKSGDELGGEQLYSFTDKGDRRIALRPELTLSVARMIANKLDNLRLPLRWFSIDNCFRYERPQKGRLREFWQAEINIVGKPASEVDLEVMRLVIEIFKAFKAQPNMYYVLYNHRGVLEGWIKANNWENAKSVIFKTLDDWFKLDDKTRNQKLLSVLNEVEIQKIFDTVNKQGSAWEEYLELTNNYPELKMILEILPKLYPDVRIEFTPAIIRGQAYYTGLILECFDANRDNPRSLFGGGRFDDLLDIYGKKVPAIGCAPGDTTMHEFLENWNLYPESKNNAKRIGIIVTNPEKIITVFKDILPEIQEAKQTFDIDYDYNRTINKRRETLIKRGCDEIREV